MEQKIDGESYLVERSVTEQEQHMASTSQENAASASNVTSVTRTEKPGYDQLPKEMHEMKIRDDKNTNHDEKVNFHLYLTPIPP
jgi:glycogen synthase kinase 3 beta